MKRLLLAVVLFASCGREDTDARLDAALLRTCIDADEAISRELDEADREVTKGHGKEALAILERVAPKAAENEARAAAMVARSTWGKSPVADVRKLTRDRRAAIASYEAAIRSDDLYQVVASMEAQKELERHAAESGAVVRAGPSHGGC